ncbi:hypothetical protein LX36DRAFT_651469 [Colletotrichum falcatum]|nr:hypothetical protein LX36DRAFT_651469 [Colletotrichum falcatum]
MSPLPGFLSAVSPSLPHATPSRSRISARRALVPNQLRVERHRRGPPTSTSLRRAGVGVEAQQGQTAPSTRSIVCRLTGCPTHHHEPSLSQCIKNSAVQAAS